VASHLGWPLVSFRPTYKSTRSSFSSISHDHVHRIAPGSPVLVSSYHPSQQNTSTGKLNEKMLLDVFRRAKKLAKG